MTEERGLPTRAPAWGRTRSRDSAFVAAGRPDTMLL